MDPEDFLFEEHAYGYHDQYVPEPPWWDLRSRWSLMSPGHRTNAVLYALSAVSLALLMFEVTTGENSPDLEVASQVAPASSTTSTSRPNTSSTTPRVSSTTSSTVARTTGTTRAATTGTTRRPTAAASPARQSAPQTEDPDVLAADPDPGPGPINPPPQQTTSPPGPTTPAPTTPRTTQPPDTEPPATSPPVTLGERACELLAQVGRTHPSCP